VPWQQAPRSLAAPRDAAEPPPWLRPGARVGYTSRSTGRVMEVVVEKVSKLRREVTITFMGDRNTWKIIPFSMILGGSSPLVPLERERERGSVPGAADRATGSSGGASAGAAAVDKDTLLRRAQQSNLDKDELLRRVVKPRAGPALAAPLVGGMMSKVIPDQAITASSYFMNSSRHGLGQMWRARIDNTDSAWRAAADDAGQCIRWDLGGIRRITKVQTKGSIMDPHWVTQFELSHSLDGKTWARIPRSFRGNVDQDTLAEHELAPPVEARVVRLHPTAWHEHVALRAELLGVEAEGELVEDGASDSPASVRVTAGPANRSRSRRR